MTTKNAERSNRWTAFQCPSCFGLFRIQRFNEGKKGVCPICRSVIAIPDEGVRVVPPVAEPEVMGIEAGQELLDKIAVAKPMTQEELDEAVAVAASSRERRRVYAGGAKEQLDWEEGGSEVATRGISPYLIGVVAMIGVLIAAGGIYYVQTAPSGRPGSGTTIVGDAASNRALEESMKITEGDVVKHQFKFSNTGKYPLEILKAEGTCGCTVPTWPKDPIKPGDSADIEVSFNTSGKPNRQSKSITLTSNTESEM